MELKLKPEPCGTGSWTHPVHRWHQDRPVRASESTYCVYCSMEHRHIWSRRMHLSLAYFRKCIICGQIKLEETACRT